MRLAMARASLHARDGVFLGSNSSGFAHHTASILVSSQSEDGGIDEEARIRSVRSIQTGPSTLIVPDASPPWPTLKQTKRLMRRRKTVNAAPDCCKWWSGIEKSAILRLPLEDRR